MIFYFSGVGNSAWVARKLGSMLHDRVLAIAEEIHQEAIYIPAKGERVGFVFPVYGWEPPKIVLDFIRKMQMQAPDYLYFVCTCGDDTGKTNRIFTQAIEVKGWRCHAGYSITMPDTYVCLPGFDVDSEDELKGKTENAAARVKFIADELEQKVVHDKYNCLEGAFPNVKTYVLGGLFRKFLMSPKPFHATDACISCGLCEKRCPVHNIKVESKPQWGSDCTMCLACYHACPVQAIQYGGRTKGKGQYKGEHLI
ncbi:MAG: EFR1 family ferrodoxin [Bacteroidaceae bacterium]|nr:EFR1 family ferrodoxin [Bacteroidaceae bacterium]